MFQGITPGHSAFVLSSEQRQGLLEKNLSNQKLIFPYLIGDEILSGISGARRFVLDFQQRSMLEAQAFRTAFEYVRQSVLPDRMRAAEDGKDAEGNLRPHHKQFLDRWWKLSWDRADLVAAIQSVSRYLVCSRVTKRPIFAFLHATIRPGDALQVFIFQDDYSFGILQSNAHWQWFVAKCSKLTERFRYTPESVFDTFPWPQSPTVAQIDAVAEAGRRVRRVRDEALRTIKGGLRAVYRTLELPGKNPLKDAHAALDRAVLDAYGFDPEGDRLAQLLALNLDVSRREQAGEPVTAPGIPPGHPDPSRLVTDDCIRPDPLR